MPPTKRDRRLPFEAHDARLFDLWRRGTVETFILAEVTAEPGTMEAASQSARLTRLNQMMNAARAAAKRAAAPGWEDLYRATIRLQRDPATNALSRLVVEPRSSELDSLLGDAAPTPAPVAAPTERPLAPTEDILSDLFGPPPALPEE